jgi:hypothetical protein
MRRPGIAERDRRVIPAPRDRDVRTGMSCRHSQAGDRNGLRRRTGEIDPGGLGQPGSEPVGRRAGVDETELGGLVEILDLDGHCRPCERGMRAGQLDEPKPHDGAAPPACQAPRDSPVPCPRGTCPGTVPVGIGLARRNAAQSARPRRIQPPIRSRVGARSASLSSTSSGVLADAALDLRRGDLGGGTGRPTRAPSLAPGTVPCHVRVGRV